MRPIPGVDDAFGRSRASNPNDDVAPGFMNHMASAPQMTYFFADEASLGSSVPPQQSSSSPSHGPPFHHHLHHHPRAKDRRFHSPDSPDRPSSKQQQPPLPTRAPSHHDLDRDISKESSGRNLNAHNNKGKAPLESSSSHHHHHEEEIISSNNNNNLPPPAAGLSHQPRPQTPILGGGGGVSGPASVALSSISSRRNSLCLSEGGFGSFVPSVDGSAVEHEHILQQGKEGDEEGEEGPTAISPSSMMDSGSVPQLIMPSIKMPSRRPFTEEGKRMGRLKVLIAGDSGVGKTSLIKAIVQSCDHIVHVDPIQMSPGSLVMRAGSSPAGKGNTREKSPRKQQHSRDNTNGGTNRITEIYASTKPYPEWWSEVDDLQVLRRRKSLGDAVLDRNICFVDTPGYGNGSSSMDTITPVTQYIQAHLDRINSHTLTDADMLNMLGGEGGAQVDVVFYMVSNRLRPVDIHYLKQLSPLTNIILLVAQSDLMSVEQVAASKGQIYSHLKEADIRLFSFAMPSSSCPTSETQKRGIYAISSATGSDHENMDASVLMSPDYIQPLFSTELATLVEQVFNHDGASWLRHSAARKYVQWRKGETLSTPPSPSRRSLSMSSSFGQPPGTSNQVLTPFMGATSSYALARIIDHTHREERLAQVRLANWAADLQKSLANERAQYQTLARGERAIWLTERINECVNEGSLVPVSSGQNNNRGRSNERTFPRTHLNSLVHSPQWLRRQYRTPQDRKQQQQHQNIQSDPLGLLGLMADLRQTSLLALEVLGGLGILGGFALWATENYAHIPGSGWLVAEWQRVWGGR